jgi:hypothetical protein
MGPYGPYIIPRNFTGNLSVTAKQCCDVCWDRQGVPSEAYETFPGPVGFNETSYETLLLLEHPLCESSNEDVRLRLSASNVKEPWTSTLNHFLTLGL